MSHGVQTTACNPRRELISAIDADPNLASRRGSIGPVRCALSTASRQRSHPERREGSRPLGAIVPEDETLGSR